LKEKLLIRVANTIIHPWAMMIHPKHTRFTG
jgi:hypothetical protein